MAYTTTTGQAVIDAMLEQPDDDSQIPWLNRAIRTSWPFLKINEYESSVFTITSGTFVYTPAPTPSLDRKLGVGQLYVQTNSSLESALLLHNIHQYFDDAAAAWKVRLPDDIVQRYQGKAVDVLYQHQHADIADLDDVIALPEDYLCDWMDWQQQSKKLSVQTSDSRSIPQLVNQYWEAWHDDLKRHKNAQIMVPLLPGYERLQTA